MCERHLLSYWYFYRRSVALEIEFAITMSLYSRQSKCTGVGTIIKYRRRNKRLVIMTSSNITLKKYNFK